MLDDKVKLIDSNGKLLGIFKYKDSIKIAKEKNLDLIEINSKTKPKIFKLLNYKKYIYKKKKTTKKNKKKSTKEIKIRINTFKQDFYTKIRKIIRILKKKKNIKLIIVFKGREIKNNKPKAFKMLSEIKNLTYGFFSKIEKPNFSGNNFIFFIFSK